MADSYREQIVKDIKTALLTISTANGFNNTIASVQRPEQDGNSFSSSPMAIIVEGDEEGQDGPVELITKTLQIIIIAQMRQDTATDTRSANEVLNSFAVDIHKAVMSDRTRNSIALDTKFISESQLQVEEGQPELARLIEFEVSYRHHNTDPTGVQLYTGPFTESTVSGMRAWFKADHPTLLALAQDAVIPNWPDSSSNGVLLEQAVAAQRPTIKKNYKNGRQVVHFDRWKATFVEDLTFSNPNPMTIYLVFQFWGNWQAATAEYIIDGGAWNQNAILRNEAVAKLYHYAGAQYGEFNSPDPELNFHIWRSFWNNTASYAEVDGAGRMTGNPGWQTPTGFCIGDVGNLGHNGTFNSNIDVAEVLIYGGDVSAADNTKILNYLNNKWAIY